MTAEIYKLDNPIWYALKEAHHQYSVDYKGISFYHPDFCPFGGFDIAADCPNGISMYSEKIATFYVVGKRPDFDERIMFDKELICNQMIVEKQVDFAINEKIVLLGTEQKNDLLELVNLVQPGFFKSQTFELGRYYGIYKNNQLVAATGERVALNDFIEISAVVTHPDFTGKGYAKNLVTKTANQILSEGKLPFLNVEENNIGAIKLYEKLGFHTRRKMSYWRFFALK